MDQVNGANVLLGCNDYASNESADGGSINYTPGAPQIVELRMNNANSGNFIRDTANPADWVHMSSSRSGARAAPSPTRWKSTIAPRNQQPLGPLEFRGYVFPAHRPRGLRDSGQYPIVSLATKVIALQINQSPCSNAADVR